MTDDISGCNRLVAGRCLDMLALDDDGYPIVDYLGHAFRQSVFQFHYDDLVKRAWDFVVDQSELWRRKHDSVLAFRYAKLREYFKSRIDAVSRGDEQGPSRDTKRVQPRRKRAARRSTGTPPHCQSSDEGGGHERK
jgi:hypothetical protein